MLGEWRPGLSVALDPAGWPRWARAARLTRQSDNRCRECRSPRSETREALPRHRFSGRRGGTGRRGACFLSIPRLRESQQSVRKVPPWPPRRVPRLDPVAESAVIANCSKVHGPPGQEKEMRGEGKVALVTTRCEGKVSTLSAGAPSNDVENADVNQSVSQKMMRSAEFDLEQSGMSSRAPVRRRRTRARSCSSQFSQLTPRPSRLGHSTAVTPGEQRVLGCKIK